MNSRPLNTSDRATANAAGTATVSLAPRIGQRWRLENAAVSTDALPTAPLVPQCNIYMQGSPTPNNLIDGTFTGNLDSTGRVSAMPLTNGQPITAVWTGCNVGDVCTLSISGTEESGYK